MVISLSEFNNLSEEDKKKTLENVKQEVGVSGIVKAWDISRSKAYSMMREFHISVNSKGQTLKTKTASSEGKKNQSINVQDDQSIQSSHESKDPMKTRLAKNLRKCVAVEPSLEFDIDEDISTFSLHLETQGSVSLISETLQMLLGAEKLAGSNIQVNITVQKV